MYMYDSVMYQVAAISGALTLNNNNNWIARIRGTLYFNAGINVHVYISGLRTEYTLSYGQSHWFEVISTQVGRILIGYNESCY